MTGKSAGEIMRQAADNFFKRLETVAAKAEAIRRESDEQARADRQKRRAAK